MFNHIFIVLVHHCHKLFLTNKHKLAARLCRKQLIVLQYQELPD